MMVVIYVFTGARFFVCPRRFSGEFLHISLGWLNWFRHQFYRSDEDILLFSETSEQAKKTTVARTQEMTFI
jgi:hypothetical protein